MTRRTSSPFKEVLDHSADDLSGPLWVGIDASLTNWAAVVVDKDGEYWGYLLQPKVKGVERLNVIYDYALNLIQSMQGNIQRVVMEGYAFGVKGSRSHSIGEGGGVTKLGVIHATYDVSGYTCAPTTLKKFVCGKGNAKKNEVMLGVYKHWGMEFADDNLADAYALAKVAYHMDNAPDLKYQSEALEKGIEEF